MHEYTPVAIEVGLSIPAPPPLLPAAQGVRRIGILRTARQNARETCKGGGAVSAEKSTTRREGGGIASLCGPDCAGNGCNARSCTHTAPPLNFGRSWESRSSGVRVSQTNALYPNVVGQRITRLTLLSLYLYWMGASDIATFSGISNTSGRLISRHAYRAAKELTMTDTRRYNSAQLLFPPGFRPHCPADSCPHHRRVLVHIRRGYLNPPQPPQDFRLRR